MITFCASKALYIANHKKICKVLYWPSLSDDN